MSRIGVITKLAKNQFGDLNNVAVFENKISFTLFDYHYEGMSDKLTEFCNNAGVTMLRMQSVGFDCFRLTFLMQD